MVNVAKLISAKNEDKTKREECAKCPYLSRIFVPSYTCNNDLVVVGDAPTGIDAVEGVPFGGESGKLFRKTLSQVGFNVSQVTFTNACRCNPPANEPPKKKALKLCTGMYLFNELKDLKPKLVVLVGAAALEAFFPKERIMSRAGNFMQTMGMTFLPVIDPAYCIRNPTSLPRLRKDLNTAHRYLHNDLGSDNNFIVVDTEDKLAAAYSDLVLASPELISFDVETNEMLDVFDKAMNLWSCGFGLGGGKCYSVPLDHPENVNIEFRDKCWDLVRTVMSGPSKKIAHNAAFDLKVLVKMGVSYKNFYADTMVMAFLLDENRHSIGLKQLSAEYLDGCMFEFTKDMVKLCIYNCEDCNNTMGLFRKFEPEIRLSPVMWSLFETVLMPMIEVIVGMELEGVLIDTAASTALAGDIHRRLEAVYEAIADTYPESKDVNLSSTKQLRDLLFKVLKYPVLKKTESGLLSTDNEVLENLSRQGYKLATYLIRIRKHEKMLSTYVEKLPGLIKDDGRLHGNFNICGARTGRLSSSGPNLQNIPRDKAVKKMFVASPGCILLQADASQMELRVACSVAPEPTMIQAYQDGHDIHRLTASKALHVAEKDVTKDQRQIAKGINFGFVYGQSAEGFQVYAETKYGVKLSIEECRAFRNAYFSTYTGFEPWYARTRRVLSKCGFVEYPTGRMRRFPEAKGVLATNVPDDITRQAVNSPVQGSSSDMILFTMVRMRRIIAKYKLPVRTILTVHDSIVFEGPEEPLYDVAHEMNSVCSIDLPRSFSWLKVPMKFDYSFGKNWGELEEVKVN